MIKPSYEHFSWTHQFVDEDNRDILIHDFCVPPVPIAVGDYVEFAFCIHKGRVLKITHQFSEIINESHLRHTIVITLDTTSSDDDV